MRLPLDFCWERGRLARIRKQKQRLSLRPLLTDRDFRLFSFQRNFFVDLCRGAAERAQFDSRPRVNSGAQFFSGEIKLFRGQREIVSGISFRVTLC